MYVFIVLVILKNNLNWVDAFQWSSSVAFVGAPFNIMKRCVLCASTEELGQEFRSKLKSIEYDAEGWFLDEDFYAVFIVFILL